MEDNTAICAEFAIVGGDLDLNLVTKTLALTPTRTWMRGDRVFRKSNLLRRDSGWVISTPEEHTLDMPRHIGDILELIVPKKSAIESLLAAGNREYVRGVIDFGGDLESPLMYFPPEVLLRIGELGLDFGFDLFTYRAGEPEGWSLAGR